MIAGPSGDEGKCRIKWKKEKKKQFKKGFFLDFKNICRCFQEIRYFCMIDMQTESCFN